MDKVWIETSSDVSSVSVCGETYDAKNGKFHVEAKHVNDLLLNGFRVCKATTESVEEKKLKKSKDA